jgi:hypothetical protein
VKWNDGAHIANPVFREVRAIEETAPGETEYVDFVGTFSPVTLQGEDRTVLYLGSSNTLYYPSGDVEIRPYHAFFRLKDGLLSSVGDLDAPIRSIRFNVGDGEEPNVIRAVATDSSQPSDDDFWYTIDGTRLKGRPDIPGLYVHRGSIVAIH